jgi:hypothetical protein
MCIDIGLQDVSGRQKLVVRCGEWSIGRGRRPINACRENENDYRTSMCD